MLGVSLRLQHLAGVGGGRHLRCGGRATPSPTPRCWTSSCTGGYNSLRESRTENVRPPARTARRTRVSLVATVCSSAQKKWIQRSQFTRIPRNPSQIPMKVAACEIALGRSVTP
jgi:hypothetical protein